MLNIIDTHFDPSRFISIEGIDKDSDVVPAEGNLRQYHTLGEDEDRKIQGYTIHNLRKEYRKCIAKTEIRKYDVWEKECDTAITLITNEIARRNNDLQIAATNHSGRIAKAALALSIFSLFFSTKGILAFFQRGIDIVIHSEEGAISYGAEGIFYVFFFLSILFLVVFYFFLPFFRKLKYDDIHNLEVSRILFEVFKIAINDVKNGLVE